MNIVKRTKPNEDSSWSTEDATNDNSPNLQTPKFKTLRYWPSQTSTEAAWKEAFSETHHQNLLYLRSKSYGQIEFLDKNKVVGMEPLIPRTMDFTKCAVAKKASKERSYYNLKDVTSTRSHKPAIVCFLDGASKRNPGHAGSGIAIQIPIAIKDTSNGSLLPRILSVSRALSHGIATNNFGELRAVELLYETLEQIPKYLESYGYDQDFLRNRDVNIYLDSEWTIGMATGRMKPTSVDLLAFVNQTKEAVQTYKKKHDANISFTWVKGHSNSIGNEIADLLANYGCEYARRQNVSVRLATPAVVLEHYTLIIPSENSPSIDQLRLENPSINGSELKTEAFILNSNQ